MAERLPRTSIALLILTLLIVAAFVGGKELLSAQLLTHKADIRISQKGPGSVKAGETIIYTLTVSNASSEPAMGVLVGDVIPPGLSFVAGGSDATCNAKDGIVFCGAPAGVGFTIPGGEVRKFTVALALPVSAGCKVVVNNRVFVEAQATTDPEEGDNVSTFTTPVVCAQE